MSRTFQAAAILTSLSYSKDGGLRLGFTTNELSDEDKLIASSFHNRFGFVLFKENEFAEEEVPRENAEGKYRSKGQHYRAVLYALWIKQGKPETDFEAYYRRHMDSLIESVKQELQALEED